jgi:hypothetical protein
MIKLCIFFCSILFFCSQKSILEASERQNRGLVAGVDPTNIVVSTGKPKVEKESDEDGFENNFSTEKTVVIDVDTRKFFFFYCYCLIGKNISNLKCKN